VRHFTAVVAGTTKVEYRSFALYAYGGAVVWVSTFLFIGFHFGKRWPEILGAVEHHLKLASAALGALALAYFLYRYFSKRRRVVK
jgi:membrane protein DedA with SNARE-associated domain